MKLIVITRPEYFVVEHLLIHELFNEGLDILHLRKPEGDASMCERLLSMLSESERKRIVIHDNFELKNKYGLYGIHLNKRNSAKPYGYKGNVSCLCNSFDKVRECKHDMKYVMLGSVFDNDSATTYKTAPSFSMPQMRAAHNNGIIDEKVYAYGGINTKNVEILSSLGFGGVVVYGALAQKFNPVLADDFKEFISYFRLLRCATE